MPTETTDEAKDDPFKKAVQPSAPAEDPKPEPPDPYRGVGGVYETGEDGIKRKIV